MATATSDRIVAVVDDDPNYRLYIRGLLEHEHYQVLEAGSTAELAHLAKRREFDCLLVDYQLEDETGFHIIDAVRTALQLDPPVVMMTASEEQQVAIKAFRSGVADFIPKKNMRSARLSTVIEKAIEEKSARTIEARELAALRDQNAFDLVTGLYSRAEFEKRLSRVVEGGKPGANPCAVILARLAAIDDVTQAFGQREADEMLLRAAKRLQGASRHEDICGRLGPNVFAVLIQLYADESQLQSMEDTLAAALAIELRVKSVAVSIRAETTRLTFDHSVTDAPAHLRDAVKALSARPLDESRPAIRHLGADLDVGQAQALTATGEVERRRWRRTRIFKGARIQIGPSTVDCTVRDISENGARLRLPENYPLTSRFKLHILDSGEQWSVNLRWQKGTDVGVEFDRKN